MTKFYKINRMFPNSNFQDEDEKIIEMIIYMINENEKLDIRNIANKNYTSISSISRLAKRAGCNNFNEFIFQLKNYSNLNESKKVDILPYVYTINSWSDIIKELLNSFKSENIFLFGEGFCEFLVKYTYRKLLVKKIKSVNIDGLDMTSISNKKPHMLITFSHSGENQNGIEKIEECKRLGGKVIAITADKNSTYVKKSNYSIIVENNSSTLDYENFNLNYFYGNSLNLIEYLIDKTYQSINNI